MSIMRRLFPAAILSLVLIALALAALFLNGHPFPAASAQTTTTSVDYDSNDDGLIEISNLAQLNAVRWDLNGDGTADVAANRTRYTAAFPNAAAGMGCPDGDDTDTLPDPCTGYELKNDLTFDTNDDGSVNSMDSGGLYWNAGAGWTPIGSRGNPYTGEFQGRGKIIVGLFINNQSAAMVGLFGAIGPGGKVDGLGLKNVRISGVRKATIGSLAGVNEGVISASYATGSIANLIDGSAVAGGLVGLNLLGTVQASFADVGVAPSHGESVAGGLVGQNLLGDIKASYALGPVTANAVNSLAGGLVGINQGTIAASYARGFVSVSGHNSYGGGLAGYDRGQENHSYWDTAASGRTVSAGGLGQSSSALQSPTGYSGIYAHWNLNLDDGAGGDNPWHFGGNHQYPILVYGTIKSAPQRDHDDDDDRLVEVNSLAQLNAIRWDLNGDGVVAAADKANYAAAFPGLTDGMGCPDGDDANTDPDPCVGYELRSDLTFDSNGDGSVTATDSGGLYWNGGQGWTAVGSATTPFTGTFQGNGNTLSNLFINHTSATQGGLFGQVGAGGVIDGVKLREGNIATTSGTAVGALAGVNGGTIKGSSAVGSIAANKAEGTVYAGGLVGSNTGRIVSSYAQAEITGSASAVGGLAGHNGSNGSVVASYSIVASSVTSRNGAYLGGLVGHNQGAITATYSRSPVKATGNTAAVGGLVGYNQRTLSTSTTQGTITASYSRGLVVATGTNPSVGGLVGKNSGGVAVNSYWDTRSSGQNSSALGAHLMWWGRRTYTDGYAHWNLNLDGVSGTDDPWDFSEGYPLLKYGGLDVLGQLQSTIRADGPLVVGQMLIGAYPKGRLTRARGGFVWELSDDGITGWTVATGTTGTVRPRRGASYLLITEPSEVNKRFRVRVNTTTHGWVYSLVSQPLGPAWSGATTTLTFTAGHNPPRVGQQITTSGNHRLIWIRCNDAAGNGCVSQVGFSPQVNYTPQAGDQGKYLYGFYYNTVNSVTTKVQTPYIGPVAAAASPSS